MRSSTRAFACTQQPRPASDTGLATEPWARALIAQPTAVVAADYGFAPGEAGYVQAVIAELLAEFEAVAR